MAGHVNFNELEFTYSELFSKQKKFDLSNFDVVTLPPVHFSFSPNFMFADSSNEASLDAVSAATMSFSRQGLVLYLVVKGLEPKPEGRVYLCMLWGD